MDKIKVWYKLTYYNKQWTIWKYQEGKNSYGSLGIYSSNNKQDCIDFCIQNKIKLNKKVVAK